MCACQWKSFSIIMINIVYVQSEPVVRHADIIVWALVFVVRCETAKWLIDVCERDWRSKSTKDQFFNCKCEQEFFIQDLMSEWIPDVRGNGSNGHDEVRPVWCKFMVSFIHNRCVGWRLVSEEVLRSCPHVGNSCLAMIHERPPSNNRWSQYYLIITMRPVTQIRHHWPLTLITGGGYKKQWQDLERSFNVAWQSLH